MTTITNTTDISLSLAIWLLHDEYDYINEENYISVTGLMKPLRQIILPSRIPPTQRTIDVQDLIASSLGHAIHDSIEKAWLKGGKLGLLKLGYPQHIVDRMKVNPEDDEIEADTIPVFLEQRSIRPFKGRMIGGKFDMVCDGIVEDNKSTSAWAWIGGTRDDEHRLQMSLYRWVDAFRDQPRITQDFGRINYIFTDWSKMMAKTNPQYPQKRVESKSIQLLTLAETERWIANKLALIDLWKDAPETEIPHCTDEELWRSEPQYKYFSDPSKTDGRSTKNFTELSEANAFMASKGKGIVVTKPGEAKRCSYCHAFDACTQKDAYL